jgi:transcriptional regulator GlxA family with amidase domain
MSPHQVVVLALDGIVTLDLGVPIQVFSAARTEQGPLYRVRTCTSDGGPVTTSGHFQIVPEHGPEILDTADTVIIPGIHGGLSLGADRLRPADVAALQRIPPTARVVSICTGAFALAAVGRLDGRPATTHWGWADLFRSLYPSVHLNPDVLFVDDGDVLTSAGVAAGIDLCLHIVRRDHGSEVANVAARRCVVPPWRDGGQAQFIPRTLPPADAAATGAARAWALRNLHEPLDLAGMAAEARMSVRSFTRRFRQETGMSPAQWLIGQRVDHARLLLETTDLAVDEVARQAGFGSTVSLRQHLHAAVGVAPLAYRRTYRPSHRVSSTPASPPLSVAPPLSVSPPLSTPVSPPRSAV